jgi:hypothetical protein
MSEDDELREFARRLVHLVGDRAIAACDRLAAGEMRGARGEHWRSVVADATVRHALTGVIPDVIDEVLFELLNAIDNNELPLGWQRADSSFVALEELGKGEMAGWLTMGAGGWIEEFSTQRFNDYSVDLPALETDGSAQDKAK